MNDGAGETVDASPLAGGVGTAQTHRGEESLAARPNLGGALDSIRNMDVRQTPAERFDGLPGWPFVANERSVDAEGSGPLRMAYIDEGPADGPVALLLHGEPTWSYLYRHMIGPLVAGGMRVIAPDLIGFGRSDKPTDTAAYTYARHAGWLRDLLFDQLDLQGITLFGQDWGGLLGLRLVGQSPERFAAVVASNTFLPDGRRKLGPAFEAWRTFSQQVEVFPFAGLLQGATKRELRPDELAAYEAPFPDDSFTAGARIFPMLVPDEPDDPGAIENREAWKDLATFSGPFVCAFGDSDPITAGADRALIASIAGAADQPHETITDCAHFSQEDAGPRLAEIMIDAARRAGVLTGSA